ncbi:MAG TPA: hypothetical protein VH497_10080 [Vicinamibacterales bacterium]|jgi:hypothetical protein
MLMLTLLLWQTVAAPPKPLVDPDAYAVYAAVLPSNWLVRTGHATRLVIQDTTEIADFAASHCYPKGADIDNGAWTAALDDFKAQNAEPLALLNQLTLDRPYELVPGDHLRSFFKTAGVDGWENFMAAYPDASGYIQLSAVGFDRDKTKAIVYVAHHCGGLCGKGTYHFLERQQGQWRQVSPNVQTCMWVS